MAITSDVAGQLLTKQYRKEKIFGIRDHPNPFKAPGSVRKSTCLPAPFVAGIMLLERKAHC